MTKKKFKTLLSFTAILLALLMLSFPVTALSGINESASSAAPPDTTQREIQHLKAIYDRFA